MVLLAGNTWTADLQKAATRQLVHGAAYLHALQVAAQVAADIAARLLEGPGHAGRHIHVIHHIVEDGAPLLRLLAAPAAAGLARVLAAAAAVGQRRRQWEPELFRGHPLTSSC